MQHPAEFFDRVREERAEFLERAEVEPADEVAPGFVTVRARARPLSPEDRRDAIITAILPLLRERGRDVSTRELAEAAGVAEGTLFRAFGDKESILEAATARVMDPLPLRTALRGIDRELPVEERVVAIVRALRARFTEVGRYMAAMGLRDGPAHHVTHRNPGEWLEILREILAGDEHRLAVDVDTLAHFVRLVTFASSIEQFARPRRFDDEEIASLILHGVIAPN